MVRYTPLVLVALLIDGLQAALSWGIAAIAAFPVTAAGGVIGCAAGNAVAGQIGCWLGGTVLGIFGTTGNALAAPFTIPFGIAMGLAINMTLSFVLGGPLIFLLMLWGLKPQKRLWWSGAELVPGINNVPCWTFFTFSCIWAQSKTKTARRGVLGLAGLAIMPVHAIMTTKESIPGNASPNNIPQPTSGRELIRASERQFPERVPLHDIRAPKSNVQTA